MTNESTTARPRVLLTNAIHPELMPELSASCDVVLAPDARPETLRQLITDIDGLIVRSQLPPDLFDHAPRLKAIVRHGVGLDMIPVPAATAHGIPVANLPGSNTTAVVEYCVAAMLHLRRRLARIDTQLRQDGWAVARPIADQGLELAGSRLGIVGVGVWFARRNRDTNDFFRGGQHVPFWAAACSIYATMLSSLTYLGLPALVFATDWLLFPGMFMILAMAPVAIRIAMPFFRRIDATSA